MARPISWLPRLHEITRHVSSSVRSHYDRRDLQQLFELQPRAAQKLLEMLPTVEIGTSRLVARDALATFLDRVREADDTNGLFDRIRQENAAHSRRRIRSLVRRDLDPVTLDALPPNLTVEPGHLAIRFRTTVELAEAMYALARVLQDQGDDFALRYELPAESKPATP